ncbi:MAG: YqaE/Pmp3 family membrane protein [Putridiphycobacter sp.]|nr:YqaE/Pmp3 family membrane protein [Putridiphycobacter sp.]
MKKYFSLFVSILTVSIFISSCATSNDVASNKLIQKRKHLKGYHISTGQSLFNKSSLSQESESLLVLKNVKDNDALNIERELRHNNFKSVELKEDIASSNVDNESTEASNLKLNKSDTEKTPTTAQTTDETSLVVSNTTSSKKSLKKIINNKKKTHTKAESSSDEMLILLIILCFIFPPIAVGLKTDWDLTKLLISILLTIFFWVPGIIYAILVVFDII